MNISLLAPGKNYFENKKAVKTTALAKPAIPRDVFIRRNMPAGNISFQGLTGNLGKKAYANTGEIKEEVEKYPKSNGVAGSIPSDWVNKIPKGERREKIKQLYKDFDKAVDELRNKDFSLRAQKETSVKLTAAMHEAGILSNEENINLKYLDEGDYGRVYLIESNNNEQNNRFVIKIFRKKVRHDKSHNTHIEINKGMYWQKQFGKETDRTNFYFGDIESGYMITQYVDKNMPGPKRKSSPELIGITYIDKEYGRNQINGHYYDYGGFKISSPILANNKTARYIARKMEKTSPDKRLQYFKDILNNKKTCNYNDKIIGLACCLFLLEKKDRLGCFNQLEEGADSKLKEALAENLKDLPEEDDRKNAFNQLIERADNKVKEGLARNLNCLPKGEFRINAFNQLIKGADNKVKEGLARNLNCLPEGEFRINAFNQLIERADNEVKEALAGNLKYLPEGEFRINAFNKLIEGADNEVKEALGWSLKYLPKGDDRINAFKQLIEGADNKVKEVLAENLIDLSPGDDRINAFKQLIEGADNKVKEALAGNLKYLSPGDDRINAFKQLIEEADNKVKKALAWNLIDLSPGDDRINAFNQLIEEADNEVKKALARNLYCLPEKSRINAFKQLIEEADNEVKKALAQSLYHLPRDDIDECRGLIS